MDNSLIDGQPESIVLWKEDEWWIIRHERTGVTTQGESRLHALLMLADALDANFDTDEDLMELSSDVFTTDDTVIENVREETPKE